MSEPLSPMEMAEAAAKGVSAALKARPAGQGGEKSEMIRPRLICGIPPVLYAVEFDGQGNPGKPTPTQA